MSPEPGESYARLAPRNDICCEGERQVDDDEDEDEEVEEEEEGKRS
jgi:hypothetical protein